MSNIILNPAYVSGNICGIPSKSVLHRAIIIACLCGKKIRIDNVFCSEDISATINSLKNMGAEICTENNSLTVDGKNMNLSKSAVIDANESGSTLRFLIPVATMIKSSVKFIGNGRLPQRPIDDYLNIFKEFNVKYFHPCDSYLPLDVYGSLDGDCFSVRGDLSSQFITGLLLCGMIRPIRVKITTPLESKPYVDLTVDILRKFGCTVTEEDNEYFVKYENCEIDEFYVENDWSQAAFFMCAGAINGDICVKNMNFSSVQGDRKIVDLLKNFGADLKLTENGVYVKKSELKGIKIDAKDIPDLVPVLSVLACFADGKTEIFNAGRLKYKESNRLSAICEELSSLGADITSGFDCIKINGKKKLSGGTVNSHNDHRIVMSCAVASAGCDLPVTINGYEAVKKSYPDFFDDWRKLL